MKDATHYDKQWQTVVCFHTAEDKPSLPDAQGIVGGYVELVRPAHNPHIQLLVNEDGRIFDLPVNHEASRLAGCKIVGRAIVLSGAARWT